MLTVSKDPGRMHTKDLAAMSYSSGWLELVFNVSFEQLQLICQGGNSTVGAFAWLQEGEKKIPSPTCLTRIKIIADNN